MQVKDAEHLEHCFSICRTERDPINIEIKKSSITGTLFRCRRLLSGRNCECFAVADNSFATSHIYKQQWSEGTCAYDVQWEYSAFTTAVQYRGSEPQAVLKAY
jgi:hypothetical protein